MRRLPLFLFLVLIACAPYQPQVIGEPADPAQFARDVTACRAAANAYKPSLSAPDIVAGAISGGAQNLPGAAVAPTVPLLGALGGAGSSLALGLDVMGQARNNVLKHCLMELTRRDFSAVVVDPD